MASSQGKFISRDEYRTKKTLDDLRKAGKMPAELDEEGKEINPHLPQYIIQAPCTIYLKFPLSKKKIRVFEPNTTQSEASPSPFRRIEDEIRRVVPSRVKNC